MIKILDSDGNVILDMGLLTDYDGSKTGPDELSDWKTYGVEPNALMLTHFDKLMSRQYALYLTLPVITALVNKPLDYMIGDGLYFKSEPDASILGWDKEKTKAFARQFQKRVHYEKLHVNYYLKQKILARQAFITGDCLLHFVREGNPDSRPFDLIMEPGTEIDNTKNGKPEDDKTRSDSYILGVKVDRYKRRLAIQRKAEPGKDLYFIDKKTGKQNFVMLMFQELAGQLRGFGRPFKVISFSKNSDRVYDATIARAVLESLILGSVNDDKFTADEQFEEIARRQNRQGNQVTSEGDATVTEIQGSTKLKPGGMLKLSANGKIDFADLKTPSGNFDKLTTWILKHISMAGGYPGSFIAGEYTTSYTAHRGELNDAIKAFMSDRGVQVKLVDQPVDSEYLDSFIERGDLDEFNLEELDLKNNYINRRALLAGRYLGPVPGHINPSVEVDADAKKIEYGFATRSDQAAKYGVRDWDNMLEKMAEEEDKFFALNPEERAKRLYEAELAAAEKRQAEQAAQGVTE